MKGSFAAGGVQRAPLATVAAVRQRLQHTGSEVGYLVVREGLDLGINDTATFPDDNEPASAPLFAARRQITDGISFIQFGQHRMRMA